MALNLGVAVLDCLKSQSGKKLTAREVAEWILGNGKYHSECEEKKANSQGGRIKTKGDLVQQLIAEIGARRPTLQKHNPQLKTTEGRPRKYYYTENTDDKEVEEAEKPATVATATATLNVNVNAGCHRRDKYR